MFDPNDMGVNVTKSYSFHVPSVHVVHGCVFRMNIERVRTHPNLIWYNNQNWRYIMQRDAQKTIEKKCVCVFFFWLALSVQSS